MCRNSIKSPGFERNFICTWMIMVRRLYSIQKWGKTLIVYTHTHTNVHAFSFPFRTFLSLPMWPYHTPLVFLCVPFVLFKLRNSFTLFQLNNCVSVHLQRVTVMFTNHQNLDFWTTSHGIFHAGGRKLKFRPLARTEKWVQMQLLAGQSDPWNSAHRDLGGSYFEGAQVLKTTANQVIADQGHVKWHVSRWGVVERRSLCVFGQ